ncbi:hypothetical protein UFOVP1020_52 [uncultured Caudovirales phage]|uniref:Uncharacterized protein n=1 Tax=uncultured Caudovirales phage TaxID=2100421 RepID=A0A6J5MJN2_9CAUD|nr:hypothetical protein UFOVP512_3 [uncultured Caudovirales phage]CAB4178711.1 hypothetical protein UFOVP1020_52 [uncultured Caudovirales phage]CAB4188094.1 hypothetical protein UFOVP1170_47 [uncultured Caudovirales phage]CAB4220596.1 hypothetical protein UFOVP1621_52 [uncultured Caudovirales phage]
MARSTPPLRSAQGETTDPARNLYSSESYRVQAMVDGLDQVAVAMERKWGVGRLRLLVSDLLRAKFDEQKDRLDQAVESNQEAVVRIHAEGMRRAWEALDRSAREAGETPLAPEVWECVLPDSGEIVSLVRTEAEAHHVAREGRVFTVAEIATLIVGLGDGVLEAKKRFPGAAVTAIRRKPAANWARGDDVPF